MKHKAADYPSNKPFPPSPQDVVIVSAVRTPLCRAGRKGKFANTAPSALLSVVLRGCLQSPHVTELPTTPSNTITSNINDGCSVITTEDYDIKNNRKFIVSPEDVQDICIGNVLGAPSEFVSMRMAQLASDLPFTIPLSIVNRQCSSGLQAIQNIVSAIQCGTIKIGIAGGVESMSSYPMMASKPTTSNSTPPLLADWDIVGQYPDAMDCLIPMGVTSENVTKKYSLQRSDLDLFAYHSHRKAHEAQMAGKFVNEIIPVGDVSQDDGIRASTTMEVLSNLPPVFDKETGMTTAGNSSQLTDGAAATLLMTRGEAMKRNLRILGVWRGFSVVGVPPKIMGIGPRYAIPRLLALVAEKQCLQSLESAKIELSTIDVFEINEAFASQASWCTKELHIDPQKVNPNGGAIALGHPLGCTGARLVVSILHEMNRSNQHLGIVSMCVGTGMGAAALLEVENPTGEVGDYAKSIRSAL